MVGPRVMRPATSRSSVLLPDIFAPFPSSEPKLHPDYTTCRLESELWLANLLDLDAKARAKLARADFTYFTAVWMADASYEAFRIAADWMDWAFYFDDEFEVGSLKDDPGLANAAVAGSTSVDPEHYILKVQASPFRLCVKFGKFSPFFCWLLLAPALPMIAAITARPAIPTSSKAIRTQSRVKA